MFKHIFLFFTVELNSYLLVAKYVVISRNLYINLYYQTLFN